MPSLYQQVRASQWILVYRKYCILMDSWHCTSEIQLTCGSWIKYVDLNSSNVWSANWLTSTTNWCFQFIKICTSSYIDKNAADYWTGQCREHSLWISLNVLDTRYHQNKYDHTIKRWLWLLCQLIKLLTSSLHWSNISLTSSTWGQSEIWKTTALV